MTSPTALFSGPGRDTAMKHLKAITAGPGSET
jgi:hypothetical protein